MKRLLFQIAAAFAQNPFIGNFFAGRIHDGNSKRFCTPGLNCYSCPAAVTSCPIGAIQSLIAGARHSVSLFVGGFLIVTAALFGRYICGYVCPFGLFQDLLYRIPTPKIKVRFRYLRYIKYA
ncbi:MAG: 4Fe-4S binding protein, partial [Oscillospiraceae bacterium]|nr:4Fe-4S binding protein [Oscillospiraceae bacterium]